MTTAATIIKQAMQDISQLGAGQSASTNDETDVLARLNDMVESWSLSTLRVPFRTQASKALDGSASYTIGTGGDINTTRPTSIESAFVRDSDGEDYPLRVLRDRSQYDSIHDKDLSGRPYMLYYEPAVPLGTVYLWYAGDSEYTLYMNTRGQLTSFPDTTTDVDLAPGYKKAFIKNLAIDIAPMFEVTVSQELMREARDSLTLLQRLNRQTPVMDVSVPAGSSGGYRIEEG